MKADHEGAGGHRYMGQPVLRREDARLLAGKGCYIDDLRLPGMHYVAFLRSPYAHAKLLRIDAAAALKMPGVDAVFTGQDLAGKVKPLAVRTQVYPGVMHRERPMVRPSGQEALATDRVRYVGEPLAMVVGRSRAVCEDALEAVQVEYEPLDVLVDPEQALQPWAACLYPDFGDNCAVSYTMAVGDVESAFAQADFVLRHRFRFQRQGGNPMETRGIVSAWDARTENLTVWSSTQVPHMVQGTLAECLGLGESQIRVAAPDVGGGFGTKSLSYPEEVAMGFAAMALPYPLKWTEDRREHLMSAAHARDQIHDLEVAVKRDGTLVGIRDNVVADVGAHNPYGVNTTYNTVAHLPGPYRVRHYQANVRGVYTNKTPAAPYRGAGRPEGVFAIDRALDMVARELGIDPVEIRRRNMITSEEMPYDTGHLYKDGEPMIYDSGDYPGCLDLACEAVDYDAFRQRQAEARAEGLYIGVGFSAYVEGTGQGPFEGARIRIDGAGRVVCAVSTAAQGQGHETTWAQICAEVLGVDVSAVRVLSGDTAVIPYGRGTYGSRSGVLGGSAIFEAAQDVRAKALAVAGDVLEVHPEDLEVEGGRIQVRGVPEKGVSYGEIARLLEPQRLPREGRFPPGLAAERYFAPQTCTYANGVHAAVVAVDADSGKVSIEQYVVAHDAGRVINPLIAEGQIQGGVAQGVGSAMYEAFAYDSDGQLLTGTFMDYLLPSAEESPNTDSLHMESLSPRNPLGVKGLGEGGAICPPAAIANAVADALAPLPVALDTLPLSPLTVWQDIREARAGTEEDAP